MPDIHFECPECKEGLVVESKGAGRIVACPKCSKKIQIPAENAKASPQPQEKFVLKKPQPATFTPTSTTRACPFCGEAILKVAIKCKHCGSDLQISNSPAPSQVGLSALVSTKVRGGVLIAVACLSILAFFMPNAVITIPILGKMKISMYDVVTALGKNEKAQSENSGSASQPDTKEMIRSFKITESGVGGIICAISVLGIMLHYLLSIVWCVCRFAFRRSVEVINTIWLAGAIQFPVLLTIGSSIVLASMKREMAQEKGNEFAAALGTALMNSFSIDAGLIMWALFLAASLGLTMPLIARKLAVGR